MQLIDIHTHSIITDGNLHIVNAISAKRDNNLYSVGIHPWEASQEWQDAFRNISKEATARNVIAIGECGLDLIKSQVPERLQYEIFVAHAKLAEELNKPLIIHLVKAQHLLLKAAKEHPHKVAWIVHGFRGKAQQAQQLLSAGMYLSLGAHFNIATAKIIPTERLFIESDESNEMLIDIYSKVANARECSIYELAEKIAENATRINLFQQANEHISSI